jgi:aspartyl/asparaginyl-tRNA synthetase
MTSTLNEEDNYGIMPLIQSKEKIDRQLLSPHDINESLVKQIIWVRGRLHKSRDKGKQCFLVIRHQSTTIQAIVRVNEHVNESMVKFAAK